MVKKASVQVMDTTNSYTTAFYIGGQVSRLLPEKEVTQDMVDCHKTSAHPPDEKCDERKLREVHKSEKEKYIIWEEEVSGEAVFTSKQAGPSSGSDHNNTIKLSGVGKNIVVLPSGNSLDTMQGWVQTVKKGSDGEKKYNKVLDEFENNTDNTQVENNFDRGQQRSMKPCGETHCSLLDKDQQTRNVICPESHVPKQFLKSYENLKQVPASDQMKFWRMCHSLLIIFSIFRVGMSSGLSVAHIGIPFEYGGSVVLSSRITDGLYSFSNITNGDVLSLITIECVYGQICSPVSKKEKDTNYTGMINATHVSLTITNITADTPTIWNLKKDRQLLQFFKLYHADNVTVDGDHNSTNNDSATRNSIGETNGASLGVEGIIGIVVGLTLPAVVAVVAAVCCYCKRKGNNSDRSSSQDSPNYSSVPLGARREGMNYEMETNQRPDGTAIHNGSAL